MSTRAQIGFYRQGEINLNNWEVLLYRHSDGYPDGVLPDVIPFLQWWNKRRAISDIEYCSARLLQYLCNKIDEQSDVKPKGLTGTVGYGICKDFHGDIEYYYAIFPDRLEVYWVPITAPEITTKWKKIAIVKLNLTSLPDLRSTRFETYQTSIPEPPDMTVWGEQ
ncbi:MAG: hypothetical protein DDT33_01362 [Firmicutes bacterium]|nr:hypothetical protein [Bacillota bacterium]